MKEENKVTRAQLARDLGVSRAYTTMIANGERKPSREFIERLKNVYYSNSETVNNDENNNFTLNQQVQGSIPWRLTLDTELTWPHYSNDFLGFYYPSSPFLHHSIADKLVS